MEIDAKVCYCFHVSKRKILSFIRHEKPKVASLLSECGGAGTGCGWCVPFLKQLHELCLNNPELQQIGAGVDIEILHSDEYAKGREAYIKSGKGKPPAPASDPV